MKDLIRKILREALIVTSDTPDWVEKLDQLVKIEIGEKGTHYGNEGFSFQRPNIKFYFDFTKQKNDRNWSQLAKREIYNDLKSYFNLDVAYYGTPLEFQVFQMTWERV